MSTISEDDDQHDKVANAIENHMADIRANIPSSKRLSRKHKSIMRGFLRRLKSKYRKGFSDFAGIIELSRSTGVLLVEAMGEPGDLDPLGSTGTILVSKHARAVHVAGGVLRDLQHGDSSGALARTRTIIELNLITQLFCELLKSGVDAHTAEMYIYHEQVTRAKQALIYGKHTERLEHAPLEPQQQAQAEEMVSDAKERLGGKGYQTFTTQYGWAADAMGKRSPALSEIASKSDLEHWYSYYIYCSHFAHGNNRGTLLGAYEADESVRVHAPSNTGLLDAAQVTLLHLNMMNTALVNVYGPVIMKREGEAVVPGKLKFLEALALQEEMLDRVTACIENMRAAESQKAGE